jgi:hypothetical protein
MVESGISEKHAAILGRMLSEDFYLSPYRFAMFMYPWGEGSLKQFKGPREWQREVMEEIEAYLVQAYKNRKATNEWGDYFREAIASGRGPGKSALFGMLAHWFLSTRIGGSVWVAANGKPQLQDKTFPEIAKWVMMGLNAEFFDVNAMSIKPKPWFERYIKSPEGLNKSTEYYYIAGQLWNEETPDAFAGAHNFDGEMALFDEASGIPDAIWKVQAGVFTENIPDRFWFSFSNPRRNSGAFFDAFHDPLNQWKTRSINSLEVEGLDKSTFHNMIAKHGMDSDTVRIEVLGQFPKQGENQFISTEIVREAQRREIIGDAGAPLIMGVDIARGKSDYCVARFRRGKDARSIPPMKWQAADFNESVRKVAWLMDKYNPDAVFIDQGMGSAVVDMLKPMGYRTIEVAFGAPSQKPEYAYKRTEMYADLRDALASGLAIDDCTDLFTDLTAVEAHEYGAARDKIILERKDELRARIGRSPDDGDALALTFAMPVARTDRRYHRGHGRGRVAQDLDYRVFG